MYDDSSKAGTSYCNFFFFVSLTAVSIIVDVFKKRSHIGCSLAEKALVPNNCVEWSSVPTICIHQQNPAEIAALADKAINYLDYICL